MSSLDRRTVLASLGTVIISGTAGCASLSSRSAPAGSLRFENEHALPHSIRIEVTGVGAEPGERPGEVTGDVIAPPMQRNLTASTVVRPDDSETYESVFTESVWYSVQFTLDGQRPENGAGKTSYHPSPPDRETGEILTGKVYESGEFSWVISTTDNPGSFE